MSGFADQIDLDDVLKELGDGEFVYTPKGGQPKTITGLFDAHYQFIDQFAGESGVQTVRSVVFCKQADVEGVGTEGDTIKVDETTYHITGVNPFGDMALLILSEDVSA